MEKTLEIQLQEERERIAQRIEQSLSYYLKYTDRPDVNGALGFAQGLAFIAGRVRENFSSDHINSRFSNR